MRKKTVPTATERTQGLCDIAQTLRRLANRLTGPLPLLRGNGLLRLGDRTIPEACATPLDRVKAREYWAKSDAGQLLVRAFAFNTLADVLAEDAVQQAAKLSSKVGTAAVYDAARTVLVSRGTLIGSDTIADTLNKFSEMIEAAADGGCKADGEASSTPARKVEADGNNSEFVFVVGSESVEVGGFGETVTMLERTPGIERLIAIVTAPTRRVSVMDLARIGAAQQVADRDAVDFDADGLIERESVNDDQFESALGDDALQAARDAVGDLMAKRNAAADAGDDDKAKRLTAIINASLSRMKPVIQAAARNVQKTLDRTYERLREENRGVKLARHFEDAVKRPRNEPDYIYDPDESERKYLWTRR